MIGPPPLRPDESAPPDFKVTKFDEGLANGPAVDDSLILAGQGDHRREAETGPCTGLLALLGGEEVPTFLLSDAAPHRPVLAALLFRGNLAVDTATSPPLGAEGAGG